MKKTFIFTVTLLLLFGVFALPSFAAETAPVAVPHSAPSGGEISKAISPALDIIAANTPMAKAGLVRDGITFSENDFARVMNLARINSVTFVTVPSGADGKLLLENTVISAGQTVNGASLSRLRFEPYSTDGASLCSFDFSVNGADYAVTCSLYMLTSPNANPTVKTAAETMLNMGGYADTALFGKLDAHDPEGDVLTFQIVEAPKRGLLILNDKNEGKYTYLPENGFTGKDEFTYVVCDKYGNYSSKATVNLKISDPKTSVVYSDMIGNDALCAAINMTENGIMEGTQVGTLYYFDPDGEMTRAEFLVMAMKAAGIEKLPSSTETGFYDDSSISESAKPYVAAAKQLGYISGSTDKSGNLCFFPDEKISRAEAALTVDKIINAKSYLPENSATPVFKDASSVPEWAASSVSALAKLGIMTDDYGRINPNKNITRGETAIILSRVIQVVSK